MHDGVQVISSIGSAEGMSDLLQQVEGGPPTVYLFCWEEISALLAQARWSGSHILEFLTKTYRLPD